MVYDMLTGRRRSEHAVSAVGELQRRLAQPPPPVRSVVPEVPQALEQLLTRCTEPDAAKRFQTTAELVEAIERLDDNGKLRPKKRVVRLPLAVAVAAALLTLSGYIFWATRPPVTHDPVTLVIADFREQHRGFRVRPHARADAQARAGRGQLHQRVRPRRSPGAARDAAAGTLNETAARRLRSSRGSASCWRARSARGQRLSISVNATQAVTGESIHGGSANAASKDEVLEVATPLITRVRSALGDEASPPPSSLRWPACPRRLSRWSRTGSRVGTPLPGTTTTRRFQHYSHSRWGLDPKFGLGYAGLANVSANRTNRRTPRSTSRKRSAMWGA